MSSPQTLFLIYDGDCPICSYCAKVIRIRSSIGSLEVINARTTHPLVLEVKSMGYDLNEGFVVKFNDQYYHGSDAVHFLAFVGSDHDVFNRINVILFKSKFLSKLLYPPLRAIRNTVLMIKGVKKIPPYSDKPIFYPIFKEQWANLPSVMKAHYANRPFSKDIVHVKGKMSINTFGYGKFIFPIFKIFRVWVPYIGNDIDVEVYFRSNEQSNHYHFERIYKFKDQKPKHFYSKMIQIKGNDVIELMPFNIGWRIRYTYENDKVVLSHNGYALKFFCWFIPMPLGIIVGRINAFEEPISDTTFRMQTKVEHPLFGKIYEYAGIFTLQDDNQKSPAT